MLRKSFTAFNRTSATQKRLDCHGLEGDAERTAAFDQRLETSKRLQSRRTRSLPPANPSPSRTSASPAAHPYPHPHPAPPSSQKSPQHRAQSRGPTLSAQHFREMPDSNNPRLAMLLHGKQIGLVSRYEVIRLTGLSQRQQVVVHRIAA